jgi:hypothetical protein
MQDGFKQSAAFGLGSRELRFQTIAQFYQALHLPDDATPKSHLKPAPSVPE